MTTTPLPALTAELAAAFDHRADCRDPSRLRVARGRDDGRPLLLCCRAMPLPHELVDEPEPSVPTERPTVTTARWTLECTDCGYVLRLHRGEPRVPLCGPCRWHREQDAEAARRRRIAAAKERQTRGHG